MSEKQAYPVSLEIDYVKKIQTAKIGFFVDNIINYII